MSYLDKVMIGAMIIYLMMQVIYPLIIIAINALDTMKKDKEIAKSKDLLIAPYCIMCPSKDRMIDDPVDNCPEICRFKCAGCKATQSYILVS